VRVAVQTEPFEGLGPESTCTKTQKSDHDSKFYTRVINEKVDPKLAYRSGSDNRGQSRTSEWDPVL